MFPRILFVLLFLLHGNSILAQRIVPTDPANVKIRGELASRMKLAVEYLDLATRQQLWSGFEAELTDDHSFGLWAADWPGRTLEAYARVSLMLGEDISRRFDEVGFGLLANQRRDGSFKNGKPVDPTRTGYAYSNGYWFGNARGMLGLIWAHQYQPDGSEYLDAATKLGDHFIANYFVEGQLGAPSSFWWVGTEAMVELYKVSGERKYLDFALRIAESVPDVNAISQHTHSYLLAIRGIVNICDELKALGDDEKTTALMQKALDQHEYFKKHVMWPGGGIVEHLGQREGFSLNYWFDEGCSVFDWWGLNVDLWRVIGDTEYLDLAERIARNHLLFNQDASGGFCGDRGVDFVREGSPWPFCCAMHGTRTLAEIPQYAVTTDKKSIFVSFFYPSTTKLEVSGTPVQLDLETTYPKSGRIKLTMSVGETVEAGVNIRIPQWSRVLSLSVDGEPVEVQIKDGWCVIDRVWSDRSTIDIQLDLPIRTEIRNQFIGDTKDTDPEKVSLWHGPRQLVYNQSLNSTFHKGIKSEPSLRHVYQTYKEMKLDKSVNDTPLKIGEREYKKGVGTHSVSEITYWLNGEFSEFRSDIGIDATAEGEGAVRFKVCVDGLVAHGDVVKASIGEENANQVQSLYGFEVSAMTGADKPRSIRVALNSARVLTLVVDEAVNGLARDFANWGNARLVKNDGEVVYLSDLPNKSSQGIPFDRTTILLDQSAKWMDHGVELKATYGEATVPLVFSYLDQLGFNLMTKRPVLRSYMRVVDSKP